MPTVMLQQELLLYRPATPRTSRSRSTHLYQVARRHWHTTGDEQSGPIPAAVTKHLVPQVTAPLLPVLCVLSCSHQLFTQTPPRTHE